MIVEKNKPMPIFMNFNFSIMENGDSVFIENDGSKKIEQFLRLAKEFSKKTGVSFQHMELCENDIIGIRIWCIKEDHNEKLTNKIRNFIKLNPNNSKKDIYWSCGKKTKLINKSLDFLVKNENLQSRVEQTTGRPKTIYYFENN